MLRTRSVLALILLSCLSLQAFAAPVPATAEQAAQSQRYLQRAQEEETGLSPYIIGPQNLLQIKIFGEASVGQIYRVEEDGYIKHALVGRVKLSGMSVSEAEAFMEGRLDGDYIINPQVNIFVLEFSKFSIIGEVRRPGNYEISGRMTVIRAVSIAGGFTPIANQRGVQIIRKNTDGTETKLGVDATRIMGGDLSAEIELQADDVIVVPKSFF
jgi:protein involved in polysaccharide export with SLBB domain